MKTSNIPKTSGLLLSVIIAILFIYFAFLDANSQTVCLSGGRGCYIAEVIASLLGVGVNLGKAFYNLSFAVLSIFIGLHHYKNAP